jgi:hypothetical protein
MKDPMATIAEMETAEHQLVDLLRRLAHLPAGQRDDANNALRELRKVKAEMLARHPDILRKKLDMDKRTHQAARDQNLHDCLRDASGGHVCASYAAQRKANLADGRFALPAGGATQHSTVDTDATLHRGHHALVDAGRAKCDGADYLPTNADGGMRFDEDKSTASRASGLAKRLGRPIECPAPSRFYWETEGTRMGLDALERIAEVDRINKYRKTVGLVPLQ